MTGEQIRAARERAGLTQEELGRRLGVSMRTVGNWERGQTVPRNRMAALEAALRDHLDDTDAPPLRSASDAELLAEIARRFARGRDERGDGDVSRDAASIGGPVTAKPEVFDGGRGQGASRGPRSGRAR